MVSGFKSTKSGSVLIAKSLEPASDSVSPSLCLSPTRLLSLSLSLSLKKKKQHLNIKKKKITVKGAENVLEGDTNPGG